jgi:hypothetical protein
MEWVRQSCNVMPVKFWHNLWHIELSMCNQKVSNGIRRRKFTFSVLNPETRNRWNTAD